MRHSIWLGLLLTMMVALSTSCVAPRSVYIGATDQTFYALLGHDGSLRFKYKLGGEVRAAPLFRYGKPDRVFVSSEDGVLTAINAESDAAKVLWQTVLVDPNILPQLPPHYVLASPVVASGSIFVATSEGKVFSVDPDTGVKTQRVSVSPGQQWIRASRDGKTLFVVSTPANGGPNGTVYAFAAAGGGIVWQHGIDKPVGPPAEGTFGGRLTAGSVLSLFDVNGALLQTTTAKSGSLTGVAASSDQFSGGIFVGTTGGKVERLDVLAGGGVGNTWQANAGTGATLRPVLSEDNAYVYAVTVGGSVTSLNAQDGSVNWTVQPDADIAGEPTPGILDAQQTKAIVVVSKSGHVYALDPVKGTILWSQKNIIGGSVDSAVAVH